MTGAITINMMLTMPPIAVWCIFIGPALVGHKGTLYVALALTLIFPLIFFKLSRRIWAKISDAMDNSQF